jgi:hypothetical protein
MYLGVRAKRINEAPEINCVMKPLDVFAYCIAAVMGVLLVYYNLYYRKRATRQLEASAFDPMAAWLRAGILFCAFYLISWVTGTMQVIVTSPIVTNEQSRDFSWWLWLVGLTAFILFAYWGIWARYTIRFDRKIDLFPQALFGLIWGTALGQMLLSIWRVSAMIAPAWKVWQQWLLAYVLIGIWQWLLMDMYWDIYISPEHDSPKSIRLKTLVTHIPNVTLCLIFIAIYENYAIFIALQTLALVGCSINMRMPAPWSKEKTPAARRVPSIFWGLPRCGGYISDDPKNDPYLKAAHLIERGSI